MILDPRSYLEHVRTYVNSRYIMDNGMGEEVVLREKYFPPPPEETGETEKPAAKTRKIRLLLPGPGFAFKLDHDQVELQRKKRTPPLFHFLDDTAKPWSRRCDFIIFYVNRRTFCADCIEFKSKSLNVDKIVPQLEAGKHWVQSLKCTIEHYTGDTKRIHLRKFVFGENEKPDAYLDQNRQLHADPSIRYYHFNEVQGKPLATLENISVQTI